VSSFRIRPIFSQTLDLGIDEVQERIVQTVEIDEDRRFEVKNFPNFICLRIREKDRHFWSPRLNLGLETTADGHTHIEGAYGPNANVWGLYLYSYLAIGTLGVFSASLGLVQYAMNRHPWGLWVTGGLIILAAAMYVIAQFGQKLGAQQMYMIHQIYESATETMVEIK